MPVRKKRLIVVLGMHRSGTSAITRGLCVIGADLGTDLHMAMPGVNDKGFFEDNDVVSINAEALLILSKEWHTLAPVLRTQKEKELLTDVRLRAIEILRTKIRSTEIFAIKDPRIARLLPFWQDVFTELNIELSYVIVIRNPLSVAASLSKRDHIEKEKSCYLWLEHVVPSVLETNGLRVVVDYDKMIEQPHIELPRIAKALNFEGGVDSDELVKYENKFIDFKLRHKKYNIDDLNADSEVPSIVVKVYQVLMQVAEGNSTLNDSEVQSCLQQASACINELCPAFNYMDRQGWKLSALNQIMSERERLIETLRQQNDQLQKQTEELKVLSNNLQKETENIYMTLSWRITKPLRRMSRWKNKVLRLVQVYQNYRLVHPGVEGLTLLYRRLIDSIRDEGFRGLYSRFSEQESNSLVNSLPLPSKPVLLLNDVNVEHVSLPEDVAVHAHVYYPELAIEVKSYLENIPVKFHLYVTTDTLEKARSIEDVFSGMENVQVLDIRVTENIGRDIYPMLVTLGDELVKHDLVLHIHTKRSPHNAWMLGGWRRYMMELLIGNSQRISAIFQLFAQDQALGILFPEPYSPVKTLIQKYNTANDYNMKKLLRLAGKKETELKKIDRSFFPAGDMFWFRGPSLNPFLDMRLTAQSFEFECGQVDATLAHAIERMFPYFAEAVGLITKSYASKAYCSNQIDLFRDFVEKGLISDPVLLFDHDIGGGTNVYTRELVKTILDDGGMVLRIYYRDASWIIQWISNDDGMFFNVHSTTELFSALAISESSSIIVNSLYGCPDFKKVIFNIIELVRLLRISLDIKVHDFLALCPSPHLLDFNGVYCGVPQDQVVCNYCLMNNPWCPEDKKPENMADWRGPFATLIEKASTITFFNNSSIEVFRRAFAVDGSKIRVVPHEIEYFKCDRAIDLSGSLHIGVLGILTNVKGAKVVHALANYIDEHNLIIPITVVGPYHPETPSNVTVCGEYEPNDLPEIIEKKGINLILALSIVPETFSYTISEAIKMRLPIVAFDLGAQGDRVRNYELGAVVPIDAKPEEIMSTVKSALIMAQELTK